MGDLFGTVYNWFSSFFCEKLAEHLWGWGGEAYTEANLYMLSGLVAIAGSLILCLLFYYVINHPRFNRWWSWLIVLLVNAILQFAWASSRILSDFNNNVIADDLMYTRDVETQEITATLIHSSDCVGFGIAQAIVATIFFIIFSFSLRWWSKNCSTCPIPN